MTDQNPLERLRAQIDGTDRELLALFEKRMDLCRQVGEWKAGQGLPVLDAGREQQVLESRAAQASSPEMREPVTAFFAELMRLSRGLQAPLVERGAPKKVAYQGIPGAYGHQALLQHFGPEQEMFSGERFEDVFRAVRDGEADFGVVPIENSSSGTIAEVYDLLARYRLWIVGEEMVHVRHCLLGLPTARMEDIRRVYSHEQGFLQCGSMLDQHPDWQRLPCFNTAVAARRVAQEGEASGAAIASRLAAEAYGLAVLREDIQTYDNNFTRFVIIGRDPAPQGSKASLTFTLRHQRGTLHRALASFVALGLSLTRIESRPIADIPWEYRFFADVEGNLTPQRVQVLQEVLAEDCAHCVLLGVYDPCRPPAP